MPTRRHPKGSYGFLGMMMRSSSRYKADISSDETRWWLGTFDTAEETSRAYDAAAWGFGRFRHELNFDDVQLHKEAVFVAPPFTFVNAIACRSQGRRRGQHRPAKTNEALMAALRRDHPELVEAQEAVDRAKKNPRKFDAGASISSAPSSSSAPPPPMTPTDGSLSDLDTDFWNSSDDE